MDDYRLLYFSTNQQIIELSWIQVHRNAQIINNSLNPREESYRIQAENEILRQFHSKSTLFQYNCNKYANSSRSDTLKQFKSIWLKILDNSAEELKNKKSSIQQNETLELIQTHCLVEKIKENLLQIVSPAQLQTDPSPQTVGKLYCRRRNPLLYLLDYINRNRNKVNALNSKQRFNYSIPNKELTYLPILRQYYLNRLIAARKIYSWYKFRSKIRFINSKSAEIRRNPKAILIQFAQLKADSIPSLIKLQRFIRASLRRRILRKNIAFQLHLFLVKHHSHSRLYNNFYKQQLLLNQSRSSIESELITSIYYVYYELLSIKSEYIREIKQYELQISKAEKQAKKKLLVKNSKEIFEKRIQMLHAYEEQIKNGEENKIMNSKLELIQLLNKSKQKKTINL